MIRSIDFISRSKAEALHVTETAGKAFISIIEPESPPAALSCPEDKILRLQFHDADPVKEGEGAEDFSFFSDTHATEVVEFISKLQSEETAHDLIVHCLAGMSRSAAVATFIADEIGCDFARRHEAHLANQYVLTTLKRQVGKSHAD